jgi:Universal stress protein family
VPSILEAARSWQADLIAMATTRSSALDRWLNDGVADAIVRSAEVPVLVVPPDHERPPSPRPPRHMLVPLDGSPLAEQALGPATELAGLRAAVEWNQVCFDQMPVYRLAGAGCAEDSRGEPTVGPTDIGQATQVAVATRRLA